jgi:hypothetical protein
MRPAGCLAAALLAACATQQFADDAPPGFTLAGAWKLDRTASDDPQRLLAQLRAEALRRIGRRQSAPPPETRGSARGSGARAAPPEDEALDEPPAAAPTGPAAARPDPLRRSPMVHVLLAHLARGDFLTVRQAPGQLVLDYGTSKRSFTPGAHSVVSAEGGVADQTSGWHGREYLIRIRGQSGPDVTERYSLSGDGKRLIGKLHIGSGELPAIDLTRIYEPTTETAPHQLPTSD